MQFSQQEIEVSIRFKALGLPWEPAVGNYVYDAANAVKPSSPFQDRVYFLLNYDCFMRKVGGVQRFKELMTWLPTWSDAREILRALGVPNAEVERQLFDSRALESETELLVLYKMIVDILEERGNASQKLSPGACG